MVVLKNFLLLTFSASVLALPPPATSSKDALRMTVAEKMLAPPPGWVKNNVKSVDKDASTMKLRVHLKQSSVDEFHDLLMKISTPDHEFYGQHLTQDMIDSMLAPNQYSKKLVMKWVAGQGLLEHASLSPRSDSIIVEASVAQIEKLLNADYNVFERSASEEVVLRTLEYSLPEGLLSHIDMVQPTTFFGLRAKRTIASDPTLAERQQPGPNKGGPPAVPNKGASPSKNAMPNKSATPEKGDKPTKSATPDKGDKPTKSATPNKSEKPIKSTLPNKSQISIKSALPNKSATTKKNAPTSKASVAARPTKTATAKQSSKTATGAQPSKTATAGAVKGCDGTRVNPTCLSNLYNYASDTSKASEGLMGIAGFLEEMPSKSDLKQFMDKYASQGNEKDSFDCVKINGGDCPTKAAGTTEANLDDQYVRAITQSIPNTFYSVGGRGKIAGDGENFNEPYVEFMDYLLALPDKELPNTLSISYGDGEEEVPKSYANKACNLFAQLGARGVSVLVAAGDDGVGEICTTEKGDKRFHTEFPASCPWVTTVGGTTSVGPETAWQYGGGGFSDNFGRPSYQDKAVKSWLSTDKTHTAVKSYFNESGRAYPDISAQASGFVVVNGGKESYVAGTSAATPTFAGIVQLLNSNRIKDGQKGLGFLNPWLYSTALPGLTDIKKGNITGCDGVIDDAGFAAVPGWDPATGLGTPDFSALLKISQSTISS